MSCNPEYSSPAEKSISVTTRAKHGCLVLGLLGSLTLGASVAQATPADRSLSLYNIHTKETLNITYKQAGKYDRKSLDKINWFMRDWRNNQTIKMDPKLLDLMWEVHEDLGSKKPIHVVSSYRSSKTNEMLRRKGRKVARNSQHTRGRAVDVYFPDISTKKLRENALIRELGGVGYYPRSLSRGFVHFDTGRVRHWPRMSATTFAKLFPNGKSKHVPRAYPSKALYAKYRGKSPERHIQMALASKAGNTPDLRGNTNIQIASASPKIIKQIQEPANAKAPEQKPSAPAPIVLTSAKILEEKIKQTEVKDTDVKEVKPVEIASAKLIKPVTDPLSTPLKSGLKPIELASLKPQNSTPDQLNSPLASGLKPVQINSNLDVKIIPASADLNGKTLDTDVKSAEQAETKETPNVELASLSPELEERAVNIEPLQQTENAIKTTENKSPPLDIAFSKASLIAMSLNKNVIAPRVNHDEKGDLLMTTFYKKKKYAETKTVSLLTGQLGTDISVALDIGWEDKTRFSRS